MDYLLDLEPLVNQLASEGWEDPTECELKAEIVLSNEIIISSDSIKKSFATQPDTFDSYIEVLVKKCVDKYGFRNMRFDI